MGDYKIAGPGSPQTQPQPHCPSGEDRFAEVVRDIKADNQLSRREISAAIACEYGAYLPPAIAAGGQPMSADEMEKGGFIGGLTKALESDSEKSVIEFYREFALGETNFDTPPDPKITKEYVVSYFRNIEAERIAHIQKRDLTENAMFFKNVDSITPEVPSSRKAIVEKHSKNFTEDSWGNTWADDGSAVIAEGPYYMAHVMMHEGIHQYAHKNIIQLPKSLNEGMTEYFAINLLQRSGNLHGYRGRENHPYLSDVFEVYRLRAVVGVEALKNAFFKGDIKGLEAAFDSKMGTGSWQQYIEIKERKSPRDDFIKFMESESDKLMEIDLMFTKAGYQGRARDHEAHYHKLLNESNVLEPIRGKVE